MLNVPESVKALFKQDGIRKNFRVHFPGGELPDITNDNVVQESVRFTESLCSQDVLKFGLTEASVLEFETVGVANMYGMTIEAGIEIDLSSLSAAELAEIEAGSWDGVYVSESDTDLGFPFFRVPYGVFRVESCPRDHQAMAHRRVTAYGASPKTVRNNPFETAKQAALNLPPEYTPNMFNLTKEIMGYSMPATLNGFTKTELSTSPYNPVQNTYQPRSMSSDNSITVTLLDGSTKILYGSAPLRIAYSDGAGTETNPYKLTKNALFSADYNGESYFSVLSEIARRLRDSELGIDLSASGYSNWIQLAKDLFGTEQNFFYPGVAYTLAVTTAPGVAITGRYPFYQKIDIEKSNPCFYPFVGEYTDEISPTETYTRITNYGIFEFIYYPTAYNVYTIDFSVDITIRAPAPTFYLLTPSETVPDITFQFPSTGEGEVPFTRLGASFKFKAHSYKPQGDVLDIINSWMELNAKFGRATLTGAFDELRLSNADPVPISPGEYENFWWDEYDVLPIGTVKYQYTAIVGDSTEQEAASYDFGEGQSVYDMTDNLMLQGCGDELAAMALLDEYFIPYLDPICFTPIDLTMKGLPYLEAGDYLAVTAEDGTIAYSFAMRQTISGIQVLTAEIESTSGDIIESEEGET